VLPTEHSVGDRRVEPAAEGPEKAESSRAGQGRDAGVQFVAAPVLMAALPASHLIKQAMACCHSATNIEGAHDTTRHDTTRHDTTHVAHTTQHDTRHDTRGTGLTRLASIILGEGLIGHPLDVEMFNASQWRMREGKEGTVFSSPSSSSSSSSSAAGRSGLELRVVKAFPFVHSLRRMSVIVKSSLDSSISLFTKARVFVSSRRQGPWLDSQECSSHHSSYHLRHTTGLARNDTRPGTARNWFVSQIVRVCVCGGACACACGVCD
jgi:magnesium-transporting ATPase (P-type)